VIDWAARLQAVANKIVYLSLRFNTAVATIPSVIIHCLSLRDQRKTSDWEEQQGGGLKKCQLSVREMLDI
jgi:hypothetical protein